MIAEVVRLLGKPDWGRISVQDLAYEHVQARLNKECFGCSRHRPLPRELEPCGVRGPRTPPGASCQSKVVTDVIYLLVQVIGSQYLAQIRLQPWPLLIDPFFCRDVS